MSPDNSYDKALQEHDRKEKMRGIVFKLEDIIYKCKHRDLTGVRETAEELISIVTKLNAEMLF